MQGLILMGVGMGMVFAFLVLMILLMGLNAKFVPRFSYLLPDEPTGGASKPKAGKAAAGDTAVAVAIAAARRRSITG